MKATGEQAVAEEEHTLVSSVEEMVATLALTCSSEGGRSLAPLPARVIGELWCP